MFCNPHTSSCSGIPILLFTLFVAGCIGEPVVEATPQESGLPAIAPPILIGNVMAGKNAGEIPGDTRYATESEARAASARLVNLKFQLANQIVLADDWRGAEQNIQSLVENPTADMKQFDPLAVEQMAAGMMILFRFLEDDLDSDGKVRLGHYVQILLEHNNPTALVLYPALDALRGTWSDIQIQEAARVAYESALAYYAERQERLDSCTDCQVFEKAIQEQPAVAEALEQQQLKEEAAIESLRLMAGAEGTP